LRRRPGFSVLVGPFRTRLAVIGLLALAGRLLYILVIARAPVGVGGDAGFYHSAANLIAHGRFYYREIFGHAYVTAEHPPLYPLLLSGVALLGGVHVLAQRVVGCVVGAVSVILMGLLGRRVAGERAGALAATIAALYPPWWTIDGSLMSEPLLVLATLAALMIGFRLLRAPSAWLAGALGCVVALGALSHPAALLLIALVAWPAAWGSEAGGRLGRVSAATVAVLLVLAPWLMRNAVVFHRLTMATNSNTVIAGANCHSTYYGHDIGWWRRDCWAHARTRAQQLQGDAGTAPALRYAGSHITRLPLVAAVRILRTLNLFQPLRQGNAELRRRWVDVAGLLAYYPLLLLAGLRLTRRRAGPRLRGERRLLLAPVAMVVTVSALGWGIGRFRAPADVSLIVLAAWGASSRWSRCARHPLRRSTAQEITASSRS
jgi:hypothetical protein